MKFNAVGGTVVRTQAPVATTGVETTTFEGGLGFERTPKGELFTLALVNLVGEDSFYESAKDRDKRFRDLVHKVTQDDPQWVRGFLPWLRGPEVNMRSAPVVGVAEYIAAGGPNGRSLVNAVLQRPDEPGEIVAYWRSTHGRSLPAALKRGVADSLSRMLSEKSALKYDSQTAAYRLGDLIELVHPVPRNEAQAALFAYLLDRRHHPQDIRADLDRLPKIKLARELDRLSRDEFRKRVLANPGILEEAGFTWERLSGNTEMDAAAWEAIIPFMNYMALLRNLRNFDQAGISKAVRNAVLEKLSNPLEVAQSRQFPFRFLSAYKAAPSLAWGGALEDATDWSTANIPELRGRTLVLVDISGSMQAVLSKKSTVQRWEVGGLFGAAVWKKSGRVDLVAFGTESRVVTPRGGSSALSVAREFDPDSRENHVLGWGTNAYQALARHYSGHDRVCIFTDEQVHPYGMGETRVTDSVPLLYTWNLGGYKAAMQASTKGRYTLGGFTDATFRMMALLERSRDAGWPWMEER